LINLPAQNAYRLVPRGGAGLACDEEGLALGGVDLARAQTDARGLRRCVMRSPDETAKILRASYGPLRDETVLRLHQGLGRAAALIEAGDLGRAGIQAVMLGFPDLTPEATQKLAAIADLEKADTAWETEPRLPAAVAGAGQWTTDGGGAPTLAAKPRGHIHPRKHLRPKANATNAKQPARPLQPPAPAQMARPSKARPTASAPSIRPIQASLAIPAAPALATRTLGRPNAMETAPVPRGAVPLAMGGLFGAAAAWLHQWDVNLAQQAVDKAMSRFNLRPDRPADKTAAIAYVWAKYHLPFLTSADFSGPKLDAASEAVMRVALVRPEIFNAMLQHGDLKAFGRIMGAANNGLADYASESRPRPPNVPSHLITDSAQAYRNAVAAYGKPQGPNSRVHHLVTAEAWGKNQYIAELAYQNGWRPDAASNLMFLPYDEQTQANIEAATGIVYPLHQSGHYYYNQDTLEKIRTVRSTFPDKITPRYARAILDDVAVQNRALIMSGHYNPILKVRK
jgi:hypothetical protein